MAEDKAVEKPRLTVDDPVPTETLKQFGQLEAANMQLSLRLMSLEKEKVLLLASSKRVDEQHQRLFESVLVERGIAPGTPADIDAKSGKVTLGEAKKSPE